MAHHKYYITYEKQLNRKAWCEKRGKLHDENREKARERKRSKHNVILACPMPQRGGD